MFDCSFFQDLKADGIKKELVESILQLISEREDRVHEQAASWGVFLTPNTFNR
ncbi:hypothetical protein [Pseudobutyrivibrio xylanivorans]|uniref:hypothetical protein n=1 Tax=Pseudobutyrivibrio xylanivorans TaxID=185007 RepID=UPI00142EF6F9|nr:hypothetical protein [Pseudobutyrivibrio xylanivorans]